MATQADITTGTNAAIPAALSFVDGVVPDFYQSQVNEKIPQLVAITVAAAIPAVDAYRAANPQQLKETPMPNTGISPTAAMWLNVAFLILTGIGAGTLLFPGVSDTVVTMIKGYSADAAFIISAINVVFHAYSTPAGGPMLRR